MVVPSYVRVPLKVKLAGISTSYATGNVAVAIEGKRSQIAAALQFRSPPVC